MTNQRGIVALLMSLLLVAPGAFAEGNDVRYTRSNEAPAKTAGSHAKLGLALGAVAGGLIGLAVAYGAEASNIDFGAEAADDSSDAKSVGIIVGLAAVGGLAGYALGGGFSDSADQAFELGRERIRDAEIAAALEDAPLPELRMSSVAGFEQLAVIETAGSAPVQVAAFR